MSPTHSTRRHLLRGAAVALFLGLAAAATPATAAAAGVSVDLADYGATCDGSHDDRPALAAAIDDVQGRGGGTVDVPAGTCRIVGTGAATSTALSGGVVIKGSSPDSTLSLDSDADGAFRELFTVSGTGDGLEDLTLTRASNVYAVLLDVHGSSGFSLDNVTIDGKQDTYSEDLHGIRLSPAAGETVSDMSVAGSTVKNTAYGLFQSNDTVGTVDGVTVDDSTFTANHEDDLEFNAPSSAMSDITVTNSRFSDNRYHDSAAAAGIGVGLANVQTAKVQGNTFTGYSYDPVHVEDRSSDVTIDGNKISDSFTAPLDYASLVFIINQSHDVSVTDNTFDTAANTNPVACVFIGSGGGAGNPHDITVTGNTFRLRPNATDVADFGDRVIIGDNTEVDLP